MNIQTVKLDDLVTEGLQVRCSTNKDVVAEYAEDIKDGAKFPPVIVYRQSVGSASAKAPGGKYLLADGYHRVGAARELGLIEIEADVREGGYNEAIRFALRANTAHGLRQVIKGNEILKGIRRASARPNDRISMSVGILLNGVCDVNGVPLLAVRK